MDIKQDHNSLKGRTTEFSSYSSGKYDYARNGVLNKVLPKILFKGNPLLVTFLQLIDMRIIMTLQCIRRLEEFKHISKL